jgi:hypothetical protein
MVFDRVSEAVFGMKQSRPITVKIVAEIIDHLNQLFALTGFIEEIVKFGVELDNLLIVAVFQGLLRFLDFFLQGGDFFRGDVLGSKVGGVAFEGGPNAEDLFYILFGEFPDGKSSLGESGDQIIPFQFVKGLPDGSTTDPNLVREGFFNQTLPGI